MPKAPIPLDDDELETILIIARNRQSGRITEYEIKELVRGYRQWARAEADREELERAVRDPLSLEPTL